MTSVPGNCRRAAARRDATEAWLQLIDPESGIKGIGAQKKYPIVTAAQFIRYQAVSKPLKLIDVLASFTSQGKSGICTASPCKGG